MGLASLSVRILYTTSVYYSSVQVQYKLGTKLSHWYDIMGGHTLGISEKNVQSRILAGEISLEKLWKIHIGILSMFIDNIQGHPHVHL